MSLPDSRIKLLCIWVKVKVHQLIYKLSACKMHCFSTKSYYLFSGALDNVFCLILFYFYEPYHISSLWTNYTKTLVLHFPKFWRIESTLSNCGLLVNQSEIKRTYYSFFPLVKLPLSCWLVSGCCWSPLKWYNIYME